MRTVYFDIDDRTDELRHEYKSDRARARDYDERFEVSWIYHENALEGNILDVFDLKAALDHAAMGDGVLIPVYQRIRNHKNAIKKLRSSALESNRMPTLSYIKNLHIMLAHGIHGQSGGAYRKEIPIHRTYFHDIADPTKISQQLNKLIRVLKSKEFRQLHPIQQAANVHFRIMSIFPFDEDTGKVARLMMNYFVIRARYFPVIIPAVERQRYYESLRLGVDDLHLLITECMERQLEQSLQVFRDSNLDAMSF